MSKEIPFFELFSQLKLSSELRLKLLGAAITTACIQRETRAIDLAVTVKTACNTERSSSRRPAESGTGVRESRRGSRGGGGFNGEYH